MTRLGDVVDDLIQEDCECGYAPACMPSCPAYKPPPPLEIKGKVDLPDRAVTTNEEAADYGSYVRFEWGAVTDPPVAVLGSDKKRARALVYVTTGTVLVGSQKGVPNGAGILLTTTSQPLELKNKQELWAAPSGGPAVLNVVNERWE